MLQEHAHQIHRLYWSRSLNNLSSLSSKLFPVCKGEGKKKREKKIFLLIQHKAQSGSLTFFCVYTSPTLKHAQPLPHKRLKWKTAQSPRACVSSCCCSLYLSSSTPHCIPFVFFPGFTSFCLFIPSPCLFCLPHWVSEFHLGCLPGKITSGRTLYYL